MTLYQQRLAQPGKPELVLLHGWGMNADVWQPLLDLLQLHYSLTLFDLPGLGRSQQVPTPYSIETIADQLLAGAPEQAHWLGWSLGGTVAAAVANRAPQRVQSLTLIASNPCFVQRDDWPSAMSSEIFTGFQHSLDVNTAKTLTRFIMLQTQGGNAARDILRQLKAIPAVAEPTALPESLALLAQDQRQLIRNLSCPLLTIWGENDQLVPVAAADAVCALLPGQQSLVVEGAGHLPFLSDTEQVLNTLIRFTGLQS
ncbi:MAG: pimeloyl-ACP methyl ester esterase BioH [Marinobacterium sp.]|nr:pimeloyl-ACP methyl ester esterase BioH [Marinobacterium sp.]